MGTAAARPIHNGMVGNDCKNSITRWMTVSIQPPKYPETPPNRQPRKKLMATPTRPIDSDIRAPCRTRENMSLPRFSVPNRNSTPGSSTPMKCTRFGKSPSSRYSWPATKNRMG